MVIGMSTLHTAFLYFLYEVVLKLNEVSIRVCLLLAQESEKPFQAAIRVPAAISHCPVGRKAGVSGRKLFVGNCIVSQINLVALCACGRGNEFADHLSRKMLIHVN